MGQKNSTTLKSLLSLNSLKVIELFLPPLLTKSLKKHHLKSPYNIYIAQKINFRYKKCLKSKFWLVEIIWVNLIIKIFLLIIWNVQSWKKKLHCISEQDDSHICLSIIYFISLLNDIFQYTLPYILPPYLFHFFWLCQTEYSLFYL